MNLELDNLLAKANAYKAVLGNTLHFRTQWSSLVQPLINDTLNEIIKVTDTKAVINMQDKIENLESIVFDLGRTSSGISENDNSGVKRTMIKSNGALIYQQLFNGKIMVMIMSPFIEGYGEPKAPRTLEILRPEELKEVSIVRHVELLFKEIIAWEDFDDDEPNRATPGFQPIGFNRTDVDVAP